MQRHVLYNNNGLVWLAFARDPLKPQNIIDTNEYMIISGQEAPLMDPGGTGVFPDPIPLGAGVIGAGPGGSGGGPAGCGPIWNTGGEPRTLRPWPGCGPGTRKTRAIRYAGTDTSRSQR